MHAEKYCGLYLLEPDHCGLFYTGTPSRRPQRQHREGQDSVCTWRCKPAGSLQTRKNKSIVQQTLFVCTGYNIMQRRSTVKLISVDVVVILLGRDSQQCLYQDQMTLERRT